MTPINYAHTHCAIIGSPLTESGGCREVVLLGVFAHHAIGGKARRQKRHTFPHAGHPDAGDTLFITTIELRYHLAFEPVIERLSFDRVPREIVIMFLTISQRPSDFGCISFRPPAVQLR